jgi:hypothetical protein
MEIICGYRSGTPDSEGILGGCGVDFDGVPPGASPALGSYRGIVAFCRIRNMYKDGVQFWCAPDGIVYSCTFVTTVSGSWETSAVQFAAGAGAASDNCICFGCICDMNNLSYTKGYKNHGGANCIFAFNIAKNARAFGIWLGAWDYGVNDNIVIGNRIIGAGLVGIGIGIEGYVASYRNLIMGNTVKGHTIGIKSDGTNITIYRSIITGNVIKGVNNSSENGIQLIANWGGVVQGNTVETIGAAGTSTSAAIRLSGACIYCWVKGNSIFECPYALRTDTSTYPTYCVWVDNQAVYTGTGTAAYFNLNGGSYHIIARNTAMGYSNCNGIYLDTSIDYVWIYNNELIGFGLATIYRASAGTHIYVYSNTGFVTENIVLSGTFPIDSTGVKTVTVAHGLGDVPHGYRPYTPLKQEFQLTVVQETAVDDWAYNLLKVVSVDATNVTIKINVSTASATAGATARIGVLVMTGLPNKPGGL